MDELRAPVATRPIPKSPPLAFQTTSNDGLWAPLTHSHGSIASSVTSPPTSLLFDSHASVSEMEMQIQINKQADALRLQNQAFIAERESWQMEKDRLYRRIASLEALLKNTANGHSPARSPVISPYNGGNLYSPPHHRNATPLSNSRLASIAEVESSTPVGENRGPSPVMKRSAAPTHIDLPGTVAPSAFDGAGASDSATVVNFDADMIDEVPRSPPQTRAVLSPPPPANLHHAGHTPLRASICEISSTRSSFSGHVDTPTRSNTALNETILDDEDEERPLKGPLMLPELPHNPDEENFTMHMLDAKLQDLIEHPEESEPMVLKTPSPGVEADRDNGPVDEQGSTNDQVESQPESSQSIKESETVSKLTSPSATVQDNEDALDGGIKLRKKPSCNFGAPLGQLNPMWN